MKYPYSVKHNGKWYRPNTEVPDDTVSKKEKVESAEPEQKKTRRTVKK